MNNEEAQYPRINVGSSPDDVTGYVIFNELGMFLTVDHMWRKYDPSEKHQQGYVFTQKRAYMLIEQARRNDWQYRPAFIHQATWYASNNKVLFEAPRLTVEEFLAQVQYD